MRTRNSFLNFLASEGSQVLNILLSFLCRTVFIYTLSQEYLGVSGLFSNILMVLSLAELGIGTAMIFHIYKPVAEGDEALQAQLMNLYRRLYRIVALVVAAAGICLVPFLDVLIKDQPDIPHLTLIYLLYLFNTVSSYFFSYKKAIIEAHQKSYINTLINTGFLTIQFLVQMLVLFLSRNFIFYLLVQIVCSILTNVVSAAVADHMYPYLKKDTRSLPPAEVRASVKKNIGAMFFHRLGDVVVNNTDNLILSAFVGINSVGIYSNYLMIQSAVAVMLQAIFNAVTAGVGNLGVENDKDHLYRIYKNLNFLGFWVYSFATVAFMVLFNPFIGTWAGEDYLFPISVVLMINLVFYVNKMRVATLTFRDALGLYWYDRYKPIFEVLLNIVLSLALVGKMGVFGIFLGTLLSVLLTSFWVEPYVTYKYGFEKPLREFFGAYGLYTLSTVLAGGFTYFACEKISMTLGASGILEILVKGVCCVVLYNGILWILYHRSENYRALRERLVQMLKARREKK